MSRKCCIINLSFNRLPGSSFQYVLFLFFPLMCAKLDNVIRQHRFHFSSEDSIDSLGFPYSHFHPSCFDPLKFPKVPETGIHCRPGLRCCELGLANQ
jgi:hypothetical protein